VNIFIVLAGLILIIISGHEIVEAQTLNQTITLCAGAIIWAIGMRKSERESK